MKQLLIVFSVLALATLSHAADPVKPIPDSRKITKAVTYSCPKQTPVRVVRTNQYNQDGWQGGSGAGTVTVSVVQHAITPDNRMYCDYAAPGSIGVSRPVPAGMTCKPVENFSFACTPTK
jgi:hypothetical protein